MKERIEEMPVEYVQACRCGKALQLELTPSEQFNGALNRSTRIIANLFKYFHEQHGTVGGGYALKLTPTAEPPQLVDD